MHKPVRDFVRQHLPLHYQSVVEVGSLDINGGVRDLLACEAPYIGVDLQRGPGVDVVCDFTVYGIAPKPDLILCLEVLEHAENWRGIVASAAHNLSDGGTLIVTCATTGRAPHSARSEGPIEPDEFYENISQKELDEELGKHFGSHFSEVVGTDLRAVARRCEAPRYSVLIPSCGSEKLRDCVCSLFETNPSLRADQIVIISDGLSDATRQLFCGVRWVEGREPFVFAEAINAGASEADPDSDLVILGDHVRFETQGGLDKLARSALGASIVAPEVIGVCGQPAQRAGATAVFADWVAFICAYIPRSDWNAVGPLDERFVGYGYDDVDWCRRAAGRGFIAIAHDVTVRHFPQSSYRSNPEWAGLYQQNRTLYQQKWASQ